MLAPPAASSATYCTSGEDRALGLLGRRPTYLFHNPGMSSLNRIAPRLSVWSLTLITLSSPRFRSSRSGRLSLHGDIRLLFSRRSLELDTGLPYELQAVTEAPHNPRYSPLP